MHIRVDVLLFHDGHLELEDDDYDVIYPLSFKVAMTKLLIFRMMLLLKMEMHCYKKMYIFQVVVELM